MKTYDKYWDLIKNKKGYLAAEKKAYDTIFRKWRKRSWETWLNKNLIFPFLVKRVEDADDAYFTDVADHQPFRLGHQMKAIGIEQDDDLYGIILKAREGRRIGYVPLCDVEVLDEQDFNFWFVREYVVWFANR